ncbi:MAG: glycoside hydrolase family 38 C-terminal domain-containing protein [Gemmatimonadota bacterium]|nr:glycoside hydrolase family 38 C-terminal domain-containing protein [Gemmatimonadota bacterium]
MPRPVIHLLPHTHWDREWYLPLGALRARLVSAIDEIVARLTAEPSIRSFLLDGQTVLLDDYLQIRPEQREVIERLVRAGRLQVGPWYVLADAQIPAGESLLRNLAIGRATARQFGGSPEVLYSPDAFGHPPAWPALGLEFGITTGALWRGVRSEATGNRDLFWWSAPDGRQMLVYHFPPDGYEIGSHLLLPPAEDGGDAALSKAWSRVRGRLLPRTATRHVALFVGADHHAPSPWLAGLRDRLAALDKTCDFHWSRLDRYFDAARAEARDLVVLHGEQRWSCGYTWTLQGVHGTRAPLKRRTSRIELDLVRIAEPLAGLASHVAGASATPHHTDGPVLTQAWREVIQCHFHDSIGGCCHDAVADAMAVRLTDAEAATDEVIRSAVHRLAGHDPNRSREGAAMDSRLVLWNPAARPRSGIVEAELTFFRRDVLVGPPGSRRPRQGSGVESFALAALEPDGASTIEPQVIDVTTGSERLDASQHYPDHDAVDRVRVAFPLPVSLGGLGVRLLRPADSTGGEMEAFAAAGRGMLWNGRLEAAVDGTGCVELTGVGTTARFRGLLALESQPDIGDTYSFCPAPKARMTRPVGRVRTAITAAGPYLAGLEWSQVLRPAHVGTVRRERVDVRTAVELVGDRASLRLRMTIDNQASDHRLRLRLPLGLRGVPAVAGSAFGSVSRTPVKLPRQQFPDEAPVTTAPAQRWVAVAKGGRGLAVLAPGFFEYEWTAGGDLLITLFRSVGELSRNTLPTRPGHAGWPTPTPGAQCRGTTVVDLAVALVTADDLAEPDRLEQLWEDAFLPVRAWWLRDYSAVGAAPPQTQGIALEGAGLVFSVCQATAEGRGMILRCWNALDRPTSGHWRSERLVLRASRIRADGAPLEEIAVTPDGHRLGVEAGPHEIITFLVTLTD